MKKLAIILALLFSNTVFADSSVSCENSLYYEVPSLVEDLVGNLYGKPASEVIETLDAAFREVIGDFAEINSLVIFVKDFDGENVIYHVIEEDDIWSAAGGSEYYVKVSTETGVADITAHSCWESGE